MLTVEASTQERNKIASQTISIIVEPRLNLGMKTDFSLHKSHLTIGVVSGSLVFERKTEILELSASNS